MADLNPLYRAARRLQAFCERKRWRFCFIGGLSVQRWGEPPLTVDVDLTLLTGFGDEKRFIKSLLREFGGRRADAGAFALRSRVLLPEDESGVALDIALGSLPFEERSVARASTYEFAPGCRLRTCGAEDLIIHKSFANRDRDWADVEGVLARNLRRLDFRLIRSELGALAALKDAPEIPRKLDRMISEARKAARR